MLGLLLTIKLRLLIITQSFLPKSRLLEDDSRKYLWNECPVARGVDAHRVMLSGMHVIPLSQREMGLCVQVTAEDGRKLVPARAACSAVPVVLAVWRCVFAPSWEWQHSVVEVFIIFLMRNYSRFPRDIPIDPLDSSALHFLLLPQIDGCLNTLFSSLPTSASQSGVLFGFMRVRSWEYNEDDRNSITVYSFCPLTVLCHTVFLLNL